MGSIFKVFTLSGINRGSGDRSSAIDLGGKTLVRLQTHGKRLEMVVNPEEAWLFKQGDEVAIDDVVEGFIVFENFSKKEPNLINFDKSPHQGNQYCLVKILPNVHFHILSLKI